MGNLAPIQVIIVPMGRDEETREKTYGVSDSIEKELKAQGIRVKVDKREKESPGFKYYHWELRGVPVRIDRRATPVCPRCRRPSSERVPSG